jgi:hypothetical protein
MVVQSSTIARLNALPAGGVPQRSSMRGIAPNCSKLSHAQPEISQYDRLCPSETLVTPPISPPLSGSGGLGAPPRRGRIHAGLVFF